MVKFKVCNRWFICLMMMKFKTLLVLFLSGFFLKGQDLSSSYKTMTHELGKMYDGTVITVKSFSFNFSAYDKLIDTVNNVVYFTVREKDASGKFHKNNGYQYALKVSSDSIMWVNDVRKFEIADVHDHLLMSSETNTSKFNKTTGLEQYQHTGKLIYFDEKNKLGLMYATPAKGEERNSIKAVNIEDGSVLFNTKIPVEFDWVEAIKPNDTTLLISSSGLYGVNMRSGNTWSLTDVTGEKNKQKLIQSIMNPNAFRVNQRSYLESGNQDGLTQICSNILVDGESIYFAAKTNLYSVKMDGTLNWKVDLSKYPTSKSALFIRGGKLFMLNLGVASFLDNQIVYGAPYLLQVDATTGTLNFQNPLPMFAYPVDFQIANDLILAGKNNLYFINLGDGKFFNEIDVNELRYGNFQEFVSGNEYYVEKEGYFVPLNFINDNVIYFRSSHGKVYGVEGGRIQYEYHESELYKLDKSFAGFKLIKQKFKTYVLNNNFELVAVLDIEDPATVFGNSLYYFSGRRLYVVHASDLRK
ncbi:MAG: hypothetical protein ACK50A_13215 [Sphingobacteriaceae bacterium]